jgi:hypothetical protein
LIWELAIRVIVLGGPGIGVQGNVPDDADWKVCWFDYCSHGLEEEAGDVGEKSAFALADASLGDHGEELGDDAADVIAVLEVWTAGEKFGGDGLGVGVIALLGEAFMDDTKSGGGAAKRIEAAPAMSGSVAAAIFEWNLVPIAGWVCNF